MSITNCQMEIAIPITIPIGIQCPVPLRSSSQCPAIPGRSIIKAMLMILPDQSIASATPL